MMHEIAVGCINVTKPVKFDLAKFDHGKNHCPRHLEKGPRPARGSAPMAWWVPARAVLALLL